MRRALFFILVAGVFISQSTVMWAEESTPMLKGGVQMDDVETEAKLNAEDSRHDGKMTALDSEARNLEEAHKSEIEAIEEQENLEGDTKSRVKADKDASHEKKMRDIDRERGLEEKIHAKRVSDIIAKGKKLLSDAASAVGDAFEGGEGSQGRSPSSMAQNPAAGMGEAPSSNTGPWPDVPSSPANPPSEDQKQQQQVKASDEAKKREIEQAKKQAAEKKRQEEARQQQQQAKKEAAKKKRQQERQQAQQKQAQKQQPAEAQRQEQRAMAPNKTDKRWSDESIPGRMMKLANDLDRIADDFQDNAMEASKQFCGGMADSIAKSAKVLAQKPGTVLPKMVDDLVTYLTNDYNENNQRMYDDAVKAVDEIQKNPARFFGEHAIDVPMSATGGGGPAGGLGAAAKMRPKVLPPPRRLPPPPRRPSSSPPPPRVQPPPKRPTPIPPPSSRPSPPPRVQPPPRRPTPTPPPPSYTPPPRPSSTPPLRPSPLRPSSTPRPSPRPAYTPPPRPSPARPTPPPSRLVSEAQRREEQARKTADKMRQQEMKKWQQQQAKALEEAGKTLKGMANDAGEFSSFNLIGSDFKGPANINFSAKTNAAAISKVLKRNFGGGKAKNPHHKGLQGLKSHEEGVPLVSSQKKIESALRAAGKDSQGLVFVDGGKGTPGQIFNVRNNNGKIEFWDFQADPPAQLTRLKWKRVFFYRLE